jgi:hypothetical protein
MPNGSVVSKPHLVTPCIAIRWRRYSEIAALVEWEMLAQAHYFRLTKITNELVGKLVSNVFDFCDSLLGLRPKEAKSVSESDLRRERRQGGDAFE